MAESDEKTNAEPHEMPLNELIQSQVPEYTCYSDIVFFAPTTYTLNMVFGVTSTRGAKPLAWVQMSPEHAKVLAIMFKRTVKEWEERRGEPIGLPKEIVERRNINLETEW